MSGTVTSPETFFGFRLGSDGKIARWDKIVEYFYLLDHQSARIRVINMGPSTEEHPFLLVIISSPGNLSRLEEFRRINAQITDPRGLSETRMEKLIRNGRVVVCQSMSLHASEISATQMAPELAYGLVTGTDHETETILENVIFLMTPCFNPDGQIMVTDWYNDQIGGECEGAPMPWLYHKYCGHDNNRDAFMLNLVESRYMAKILFRDWRPQIFQDHHEMGTYGPRFFIGPYCEPLHPHADPLIWREINWYGAHMAYRLEEAGRRGVITGAIFPAWSHMGFHWLGNYHNIASMLTESATARLATPVYAHAHQLRGDEGSTLHAYPHYRAQTNFPNPWPGGWWRVRDMIDQQLVAARGALDIAAHYRETVLRNAVNKALRQTRRGEEEPSAGFFIRPDQHDPLTVTLMINKLLMQGIDIRIARTRVIVGETAYPAGTFFIPFSQPKHGVVKTLLGRSLFPDDAWTRRPDGSPSRPYDTVTDNMAEMMGVRVEPAPVSPADMVSRKGRFAGVSRSLQTPGGLIGDGKHGYALDPRLNASYRLVNQLVQTGIQVARIHDPARVSGQRFPSGAFIAESSDSDVLEKYSSATGAPIYGLEQAVKTDRPCTLPRIGLYQRYWGGNMDEGWTRLTLEQFDFPYTTARDADLKTDGLSSRFDVIVFPDDTTAMIAGEKEQIEKRLRHTPVPEAYRSSIGSEGIERLRTFVEKGGTLVTINRACGFAIEKFGLQIVNAAEGKSTKDYFCPGSMLRIRVDGNHPLGYGMPENALAMVWDSPILEITPSHFNDQYRIVASYPERDILESGWLIGESHLSGRPLLVEARYGAGRIILYAFRPQFRAQTHGTLKLLFNALMG